MKNGLIALHTPQVPIKYLRRYEWLTKITTPRGTAPRKMTATEDPHDWIPVRDTTKQAPPPRANQISPPKQQPHVADPRTKHKICKTDKHRTTTPPPMPIKNLQGNEQPTNNGPTRQRPTQREIDMPTRHAPISRNDRISRPGEKPQTTSVE